MAITDKASLYDRHTKNTLEPNVGMTSPEGSPYFRDKGTTDSPFKYGGEFTPSNDHMVQLLTNQIHSDTGYGPYDPSPNQSPYQDLDGNMGPTFDNGNNPDESVALSSISKNNNYSYQHGESVGIAPSSNLDLNGLTPLNFDNGPETAGEGIINTLHESSLSSNKLSGILFTTELDLGPKFKKFDNGKEAFTTPNIRDSFHEKHQIKNYTYQHGNASSIAYKTDLSRGDISLQDQYMDNFNSIDELD